MSKYIPLARVHFREAINVPGTTEPGKKIQYPTSEDVLLSSQYKQPATVRGDQCFELWLDPRYGQVLVTHPKSGETERVPLSMVKQLRFLDEVRQEQGE